MKSFLIPGDKKSILERLNNLRPDSPRQWGRMTAGQMICHLNDSFRLYFGEKEATSADNFFTRSVAKWYAIYVPLPWPRDFKTMPEMDQEIWGTPPGDFENDRRRLAELIERFASPTKTLEFHSHPIFGEMSNAQWMRWGFLHCDHHFRQFNI